MIKMEDLFNVIGKLYVDVYNMQKVIEVLQKRLKESEQANQANTPSVAQDE